MATHRWCFCINTWKDFKAANVNTTRRIERWIMHPHTSLTAHTQTHTYAHPSATHRERERMGVKLQIQTPREQKHSPKRQKKKNTLMYLSWAWPLGPRVPQQPSCSAQPGCHPVAPEFPPLLAPRSISGDWESFGSHAIRFPSQPGNTCSPGL